MTIIIRMDKKLNVNCFPCDMAQIMVLLTYSIWPLSAIGRGGETDPLVYTSMVLGFRVEWHWCC